MEMVQKRLLLVDDEAALLELLQKYLLRLGYEVDVFATAGDAWQRFQAGPLDYAVVIADLSLPDMSGERLLEKMLALNPALPVLVCSGYPFDTGQLPLKSARQAGFLQKPFLPKMLGEALNRLLKSDAASPGAVSF